MPLDCSADKLLVVDQPELFYALLAAMTTNAKANRPVGAAYATCHEVDYGINQWLIMLQNPVNAHPFVWLALKTLLRSFPLRTVLSISRGADLAGLHTLGTWYRINEARAVPYPAIYRNVDPYATSKPGTDVYSARHATAGSPSVLPFEMPIATAGYAKHPEYEGALTPWSDEQFRRLLDDGIGVYSEIPAGILDAGSSQDLADAEIICLVETVPDLQSPFNDPQTSLSRILQTMDVLSGYSKSTGSISTRS